jgi:hypothetical protein
MRSKIVIALSFMIALSAFADRAHDIFNANREKILTNDFSVIDDVAFVVGRAKSPRNRGDAVGWTKAESSAKWLIGDRFRSTACWPIDATEQEKSLGWLEYRSMHPNRFTVIGMQRIWTRKTPPENYVVVLSIPASQIELSPPSKEDLERAIKAVRERQRIAREEEARKIERKKQEAEALKRRAGYREDIGGAVRQQQADEDLIL